MPPRSNRVEHTETDERAQDLLRSIGFSTYESRCYIALIGAASPMNGYEVAKISGVPRSAVYESLQKLVARGAAMMVAGAAEGASAFVALPVEAFVDRLRNQLSGTLDGLASVLPSMSTARSSSVVARLTGRPKVLERFIAVMETAREHCLMSLWPSGAHEVRDTAARLVARGVEVTSVIRGDFPDFPGDSHPHVFGTPDDLRQILGCLFYVVVADRSEALIGVREGGQTWGFWSDDRAVVTLAQKFVLKDLVIQELGSALAKAGAVDEYERILREHHERLGAIVGGFGGAPRRIENHSPTNSVPQTRKRRSV